MTVTRKFIITAIFTVVFTSFGYSQKMPFPQAKDWANCIKPNSVSQAMMNRHIEEYYEYWKGKYLKTSSTVSSGYYVKSAGTGGSGADLLSVSEAHGYGMIIVALMAGYDSNAETIFNGLYKFFDEHRAENSNNNLMIWDIEQDESGGGGTATDGDIDIAYALILAGIQFDNASYTSEAKTMITSGIKATEMNTSSGIPYLGDWDNGSEGTRPSDWMTAEFHTFQEVTGDNFWNTAANACYSMYTTFLNNETDAAQTGLITDFVVDGWACEENHILEYLRTDSYNFNACRVPLRLSMDYGHYGNSSAKTRCNKISTWLKGKTGGDPTQIAVGYELNGTPIDNSFTSMAYTAPFMAGATVDAAHQTFLNKGWYTMYKDTFEIHHFEVALNLMSMLYISGNWWKPGQSSTPYPDPVIDAQGVLIDDFEDYYSDDPAQAYLGAAFGHSLGVDPALGGGFWFVFADTSGSKVIGKNGEITDTTSDDIVTDGAMHVELKTSTSNAEYPYAGVGIPFVKKGLDFFNLGKLSGLSFKAKGSGRIRVEFITKDILTGFPDEDDQWGWYGEIINLTGSWKDYKIADDYLIPQRYSPAEIEGWGWDHGKADVSQLMISVLDSASNVDMWIDSIVLNGLDYQECFNFTPQVTQAHPFHNKSVNDGFFIRYNRRSQNVSITHDLAEVTPVSIKMYDTRGKLIAEPVNTVLTAGSHTHAVDLKSQVMSSGIYLVSCKAGERLFRRHFDVVK